MPQLGQATALTLSGSGESTPVRRWRRRIRHSDVDYRLFLSDDLSQWESRPADLQTVGVEPDPDGIMETVRTKVNRPDAMRVFIGVKAIRK